MPFERSCGVILFNKEKNFLLLKYGWGHWGFIKGNIEKGEKEKETILREAEEEAGINKESIHFLSGFREKINYFYKKEGKTIYKEVIYLLAETTAEEIKLSYEHTDYAWLPYEEAVKKITHENDRNVLKKAKEFLEKSSLVG
ncbi:MAG: NUDIX domain-containing protein [Thermoplasmata archaeon]|nr:MAG: NUDIX domain-containing protein [Thermoplasmata archaeon]